MDSGLHWQPITGSDTDEAFTHMLAEDVIKQILQIYGITPSELGVIQVVESSIIVPVTNTEHLIAMEHEHEL